MVSGNFCYRKSIRIDRRYTRCYSIVVSRFGDRENFGGAMNLDPIIVKAQIAFALTVIALVLSVRFFGKFPTKSKPKR